MVNGVEWCYCLSIYALGRLFGRKDIDTFSNIENMGPIDGWLLCLSFCADILVVWIRSNTRRQSIRKLYNGFTSMSLMLVFVVFLLYICIFAVFYLISSSNDVIWMAHSTSTAVYCRPLVCRFHINNFQIVLIFFLCVYCINCVYT